MTTENNGIITVDQKEFLRRAIGRLKRSSDPIAIEVMKMMAAQLRKLEQA